MEHTAALYDNEDSIRGLLPDERRAPRQQHARPILADLKVWIEEIQQTLPQKQRLVEATRYAPSRWTALNVYIDNGGVEIYHNITGASHDAVRKWWKTYGHS
ncbi:hypothetical protein Brsp01_32010 [Brucella sp. NBRC 12950]|nr:hypothetical protein Brsp01_32010 [Brucella sp. NBRC 12950]